MVNLFFLVTIQSHKAKSVEDTLKQFNLDLLLHLPYSSDLTSDYYFSSIEQLKNSKICSLNSFHQNKNIFFIGYSQII